MNEKEIIALEACIGKVEVLSAEVGALSKKAPNDAVNEFKLNLVNDILQVTNELLGDDLKPFDAFDDFDLDTAPTNSDVVFVLAQYAEALDLYRSQHIETRGSLKFWYYIVDDDSSKIIRTSPPAFTRRKV